MKKILLASASIVAFAGAAAAEVNFGGSATLGYNDDDNGDNDGFYYEATVDVDLTAELDNGITAGASFNVEFGDSNSIVTTGNTNDGDVLVSDDVTLFIKSETAGLYFGDTGTAANKLWASAGDMEADDFTSDAFDEDNAAVLRGDVTFGAVEASVSYTITDEGTGAPDENFETDQLSVAVKAELGMATVVVAYEDASDIFTVDAGDFNADEVFGISGAASFGGADLVLAYAKQSYTNGTEDESVGLKVTYPMGDVKVTGYYVSEDTTRPTGDDDDNFGLNVAYAAGAVAVALDYQDDQGITKVALDGSYDMGNGLKLLAGVYDEDGNTLATSDGTDYYVAAEYDLGGGAALLVSYADAESKGAIDDDEVGGPDYQVGTTVAVSFAF